MPTTVTPNYWGTAQGITTDPLGNETGHSLLSVQTVGEQQALPGEHMPGSGAGHRNADYIAAARAVYPVYNFPSSPMPGAKPAALSGPITPGVVPADFTTWHHVHQQEYLLAQVGVAGVPDHALIIPQGATYAAGDITGFYYLTQYHEVNNLTTMTLSDYEKLPDHAKIRYETPLVSLGKFAEWGLVANKTAVTAAVSAAVAGINGSSLGTGEAQMPPGDAKVFTDQLDLVQKKIDRAHGVAQDKILEEVKEILGRFNRAYEFATTPPSVRAKAQGVVAQRAFFATNFSSRFSYNDANGHGTFWQMRTASLDGNASIQNGYQEFMRAERGILAMQNRRESLSTGANYVNPKLDVPNLIFQMQLLYEGQSEAVAESGTEEIRQLHNLLQDYAKMKKLVADQQALYDPSKPGEQRRLGNIGWYNTTDSIYSPQVWDDGTNRGIAFQLVSADGTTVYAATTSTVPGSTGGTPIPDANLDAQETAVLENLDFRNPIFHWSLLSGTTGLGGSTDLRTHVLWALSAASGADFAGINTTPVYTEDDMMLLSMFADPRHFQNMSHPGNNLGGTLYQNDHPIESLYGAERPLIDFIDSNANGSLKKMRKSEWDAYSTQLSETITILNQQNQIKQSEIDKATKQQNRHFELGNNALRKMNDMLMSIGRI